MAATKKVDEELMREREEAWVGDAVLALYMRELILKEQGKMDEALIGRIYKEQGLQAAFDWMEFELLPVFRVQEKNYRNREAQRSGKRRKKK